MEQHPVPQNVTTFQFRLIGDMTVKQFGYLAGGLILAYISYKLPLPFFFTWPLALLFGLGGFGFAFVPVEQRPMDVWVLSFLKNVYSPTQYLWQKQKPPTGAEDNLMDVLNRRVATRKTTKQASPPQPHVPAPIESQPPRVVAHQPGFLQSLVALLSLRRAPQKPQTPSSSVSALPAQTRLRPRTQLLSEWLVEPSLWLRALIKTFTPKKKILPTPPGVFTQASTDALTGKRVDIGAQPTQTQAPASPSLEELEQKKALERRLADLQQELSTKSATDTRLKELQEQIAQALADREKMEQELERLRQQLATQAKPQPTTMRPAGVAQTASPTVRIVNADMASKIGLPKLTTFPNVITGILKDSTGNLLSAILVTVRDKDDIPVRALKTNKIGQFASSLPLPNGTYTINIEDPREQYVFDRIALTLTGEVMPAVEVTAKNQKQVAREKLAAEIFGQPKM